MKKKIWVALAVISCILLTGCGVDLTSKQNNLAAEYIAGLLVQRSFFYENKYVDTSVLETESESESESETETPAIVPEAPTGEEATTTEEEDNSYDISTALGINPIVVQYKGYKVVKEYPDDEDAMFAFTAEDGYNFIIAEFNLINEGDSAVTISTDASSVLFRLTINNSNRYNNYGTLLLNDITNIRETTIEAGGSYEAVIAFMVPEDIAGSISSMSIANTANEEVLQLR